MNSGWVSESDEHGIGYCWIAIRWMHYCNDPHSVALAFGSGDGKYYGVGPENEHSKPRQSITDDDYRAEIVFWKPLEDTPEPPVSNGESDNGY